MSKDKNEVLGKEEKQRQKEEKQALKQAAKEAAREAAAKKKAAKEAANAQKKASKEATAQKKASKEKTTQKKSLKGVAALKKEPKVKGAAKKDAKKIDFKGIIESFKPMKDAQGKGQRSIMQTLLLSFLVPVILMVVLGIVSYQTASSGIISKYKESAMSTVSAVGDYCNLVCDSISSKALELVTNSDLGDYYDKNYKKEAKAAESFRSARALISNTKSTNKSIYSCSVISEVTSYISTLTGSMTENPYADFAATPEGAVLTGDAKIRNKWMGYHSYLDANMNSCTPDLYAVSFYQKMQKTNSVLIIDMDMEVAMDMLAQMDFGDGSIKALISGDGREVVSIQGKEGEPVEETYFVGNDFFEKSKEAEGTQSQDVKLKGKSYVYISTPVGSTGIMICALIPKSNLLGQVGTIKYITIIMVILAAGAALAIGAYISMGISNTVKSMTVGLSAVAEGDLTKDFSTKRKDEFKTLTSSLNSMLGSMRMLMQDMKQFGNKVNALSSDVSDKTIAINASMQDISRAMDEVAVGVMSQAEDTESSNERMITFAENISAVTDKTNDMGVTADKAIEAVDQGKVIVQDLSEKSDTTVSLTRVLVEDIDAVQKSSEEIKGFVDVINNIAEQTNLLSLNASIEAARAGEAGRGFAVVAEEIRKLADQSKQSGNRINEIVENIGSTTDKTTISAKKAEDMVNEQAKALAETVEVFGMIHSCVGNLVEDIRVVMQRLSQVMEEKDQVQNSIQNISAVSEEVAASTQEVTATLNEQVLVIQKLNEEVEELRQDATELDKSIDRFKV